MQSLVPALIFTGIFVVEQRDTGAHKQLGRGRLHVRPTCCQRLWNTAMISNENVINYKCLDLVEF